MRDTWRRAFVFLDGVLGKRIRRCLTIDDSEQPWVIHLAQGNSELLAVTGLTHRQAYKDILAITIIKTLAVFFIIATFYLTGWV